MKQLALIAVMAIAMLMLSSFACSSANATSDTQEGVTTSGTIDGIHYGYWQQPGSCRELTLEFPDGDSSYRLYDDDDNNVIGNARGDNFEVTKQGLTMVYYFDAQPNEPPPDWHYPIYATRTAGKLATRVFRAWRPRIIQAYLAQHQS